MSRRYIMLVTLFVVVVSGCATTPPLSSDSILLSGNVYSTPRAKEQIQSAAQNLHYKRELFSLNSEQLSQSGATAEQQIAIQDVKNKLIDDAFAKVLSDCKNVLTNFEQRADVMRWWGLGIALAGTVAGSVVVPALAAKAVVAKSAVAAWGGLAGATNTAQIVLKDEGLDAGSLVDTREKIRASLSSALDEYYAASSGTNPSPDKRTTALEKMMAACALYWISSASAPSVPGPAAKSDTGTGSTGTE